MLVSFFLHENPSLKYLIRYRKNLRFFFKLTSSVLLILYIKDKWIIHYCLKSNCSIIVQKTLLICRIWSRTQDVFIDNFIIQLKTKHWNFSINVYTALCKIQDFFSVFLGFFKLSYFTFLCNLSFILRISSLVLYHPPPFTEQPFIQTLHNTNTPRITFLFLFCGAFKFNYKVLKQI